MSEDHDDDCGCSRCNEPYSIQALRQMHRDAADLLEHWDGMLKPMEHVPTKVFLRQELAGIVEKLERIEGHFERHHADAEPLDGTARARQAIHHPGQDALESAVLDDDDAMPGDEAERQEMADGVLPPSYEPSDVGLGYKSLRHGGEAECPSCLAVLDELEQRCESAELTTAALETVEGTRDLAYKVKSLGGDADIPDEQTEQAARVQAMLAGGLELETRELLDQTCSRCGGKPLDLMVERE
jgi:hypothetical protein